MNMNRVSILSVVFIVIALSICVQQAVCLNTLLSGSGGGPMETEVCLNVGGSTTVGKYLQETDNIKYIRKKPKIATFENTITNADEPAAWGTLREKRGIKFYINAEPSQDYDIRLGLMDYRNCQRDGNRVVIKAGGQKSIVDPFKMVGCETAYEHPIQGARSSKSGRLTIKLKGRRTVSLATVCVTRRMLSKATCSQDDCSIYEGFGNITIVGASLAIPGKPCQIENSAFTKLSLPSGAEVVYAALQWGASGQPRNDVTSVILNGRVVNSSLLYINREFEPFYGAVAEITDIVREFGSSDYNLAGIYHVPYLSCPQAHLAAFSITVVYSSKDLPLARIHVCDKNTKSTTQQLDYSFKCMVPDIPDVEARATLVAIEGEFFTERLAINDNLIGFNLFNGSSGERFDILHFNISEYLVNGVRTVTFGFTKSPDHDSIILAMRTAYQTLA